MVLFSKEKKINCNIPNGGIIIKEYKLTVLNMACACDKLKDRKSQLKSRNYKEETNGHFRI